LIDVDDFAVKELKKINEQKAAAQEMENDPTLNLYVAENKANKADGSIKMADTSADPSSSPMPTQTSADPSSPMPTPLATPVVGRGGRRRIADIENLDSPLAH